MTPRELTTSEIDAVSGGTSRLGLISVGFSRATGGNGGNGGNGTGAPSILGGNAIALGVLTFGGGTSASGAASNGMGGNGGNGGNART